MKISYAVPPEKIKTAPVFIKKEIAQARNIKDRVTRKAVLDGLNYIANNLEGGCIYHIDAIEGVYGRLPYGALDTIYHCGKVFVFPEEKRKSKYLLVAMDAQEATIGMLDGKRIRMLWHELSDVPRKHNKGGQSKERFQRGREESLKQWYKKIADKMHMIVDDNEE